MQNQVETIEPQSGKFSQAVVWIAGIALTVFCVVGIAAIMGWIPNSLGVADDKVAAAPVATTAAPPAVVKAPPAKVHKPAQSHPAPPEHVVRVPVAPAPVVVAPAPVAAVAVCADCGVIESIREIDAKGKGSGIGAVGGAVVGGLLGNQVGGGRGQDVMTVVGAVGGGLAGNEAEKRMKSTKSYDVTVRMSDGSSRVISEASVPAWRTGDKVKVINGAIRSNG